MEPAGICNCSIRLRSDAIIKTRKRQNLDPVDYPRHTFNSRNAVLGIRASRGPNHLTVKGHGAAVDAVSQIVKDAVIGEHSQLMTHALAQLTVTGCWHVRCLSAH